MRNTIWHLTIVRDLEIVTQDSLLKTLYSEFDLEEIAYSMAENGYFDEEPIVVIPYNLPSSIDQNIYEADVKLFESILEKEIENGLRFIVIEGILKWESYAKATYIAHRIQLEADAGLTLHFSRSRFPRGLRRL